jgi:DNA mismatch repair protein MutS2
LVQTYPEQAIAQLEFDKIITLLAKQCRSDEAKHKANTIRLHTKIEYLKQELEQTLEFKTSLSAGDPFPINFVKNIKKELKLLSIDNAVLQGADLNAFRDLTLNIRDIHLWFKRQGDIYPRLFSLMQDIPYIKEIPALIQPVVDENGQVRDNASEGLLQIRNELQSARARLRKVFEGVVRKLAKQGYLADITESFLNGRRVVAVGAEHKRIVKGIFHGESDTSRTVFIEPEETIALNNEVDALERDEKKEVLKVLAATTALLKPYHSNFISYYKVINIFEFIRAKAFLAIEMGGNLPVIINTPELKLVDAFHPLLYLYNLESKKETVPLNLTLDKRNRILIISGPNAGGKTVAMKTVGLLQLMLQSGLLVPVNPISEMGIFKQIMIHIGDTQSIENELSTYSAHLKDMKYFLENTNGKTLFFIDELGGGTDPNLGGAFAEAIVERLSYKNAIGIITTHYLNLKVMAGKVGGIINGAMNFDEDRLEPLYKLTIGKPGSSYTFAIAQRTGLPSEIINRAKQLTDRGHFKLDKMLHQAERQTVRLDDKEIYLNKLVQEYEKKKAEYEELIDKERLKQHFATLKLQNKIKKDELDYLRDTERKFKQLIVEWKKTTNKQDVINSAEQLLFKRKQLKEQELAAQKADRMYIVTGKQPKIGDLVRNIHNHQVGELEEIMGNQKAKVKINKLSFQVNLSEWIVVERNKKVK